jgi:predicted phage terminase large subunit-like protein
MFSRIRRPSVSCLNCRTSIRSYRDKAGNLYWKHTNAEGKKCKETFPDPKVLVQYPEGSTGMSIFDVPLRMRSATNPGGVGHVWVKERFIDSATRDPNSYFVRARLSDNPSLDQETYRENLAHLLPVDRERLLNGDWDVEEEGAMFARHDFEVIDEAPVGGDVVRFWDMAATLDGDYTVGAKVRHFDGQWFIEDINRFRLKPHDVEKMIRQTAMLDGQYLPIRMEQEPGSAGVNNISHYRRNILPGFNFDGTRSTGDKIQRAYPVASAAQAGNVFLVKGAWNKDFIEEAALFPNGANDDQVDAVAGAVAELAFGRRSRLIV